MRHSKKSQQAIEMYSLYEAGQSLESVANSYGVSRQSVFELFARRGFVLRTATLLPHFEFAGRKYTMRANGYYAATSGNRSYLHRDIWEAVYGPIPNGLEVHHKDEDKTHNVIENYELLTQSAHQFQHDGLGAFKEKWANCKQGHPLTDENIYTTKAGTRTCKLCAKARSAKNYASRKGG